MKTTEQIRRGVAKKQAEQQKKDDLLEEKKQKEKENEEKAKGKIEKSKDQIRLETDKNLIPQIERNLKVFLSMHKEGEQFSREELQSALGLDKDIERKALDNILGYSDEISREKSGQYGLNSSNGISSKTIAFIIVLLIFIAIFLAAR